MSTLRTKHSNKNAEIIMKKGKSDDLEPYNRLLYDYSEFMDNGCRKHNTISLYVKSAVIFIYFLEMYVFGYYGSLLLHSGSF